MACEACKLTRNLSLFTVSIKQTVSVVVVAVVVVAVVAVVAAVALLLQLHIYFHWTAAACVSAIV